MRRIRTLGRIVGGILCGLGLLALFAAAFSVAASQWVGHEEFQRWNHRGFAFAALVPLLVLPGAAVLIGCLFIEAKETP